MSINGSVLSPPQRDSSYMSEFKSTSRCLRMHLNSLWSIWYGIGVTILNGYIAFECSKRFLDYIDRLPTADTTAFQCELFVCIGLTGFAVLLIPFFFVSALFKIGNLANDGFKLGRNVSTCSANSQSSVVFADQSGCQRIWQHCGPTASFFHLIIAFCFLIPKLMIEARCVQKKMLPLHTIWKTDLDFLIPHQEETVSMNFTNGISMDASTVFSNQPKSLPLSVTPGLEIQIRNDTNFGSVSIEFLNYALALFIYSVRYPSVFWNTNKYFGVLFSLQLIINGIQCLLLHSGVCILYKIHVVGPQEVLPAVTKLSKWTSRFGTPFILNREVTLALYVMSVVLVLVSSLVLYLYGYGRLNAFLNRERARHVILAKGTQSGGSTWTYFTHCAALCILVAIGFCEAPLLYDFTLIYRKNLDLLVLTVILSSILHLFVWVLLWLILTLKQHWEFKLQVTVGRSTVRSARSIRMVTDVQLACNSNQDYANAPLLVVGHGRTFTVSEPNSKKAIMNVIQKATMEKRLKFSQAGSSSSNRTVSEDGEEQIYWLRPKSRTPRHSPDSSSSETRFGWFSKKKTPKLSVEEMAMLPKRNKSNGMVGEEDGDYVRLREIPGADPAVALPKGDHGEDTTSEDNKLMESVRNDRITYASVNKDLLNPILREYEDPSPLLTPEPQDHDDLPPPPPELSVEFNHCIRSNMRKDVPDGLQRADSGMPPEEIPSHSGSEVSGGSPPDRTCSNSETSSGVHSNSSRESESVRLIDLKPNCGGGGGPMGTLFNETLKIHPQQWIQRNVIHSPPPYNSARVYKPQQHYANANKTPVINEVADEENTVVIRRKAATNGLKSPALLSPEAVTDRFSRSTNMRLTSFTDHQHQHQHQHHHHHQAEQGKLSATLPHYPTAQPVGLPYQHCSTMPLPLSSGVNCNPLNNGGSCGSFPRPHTTIPTHHNGVRLGASGAATNNVSSYTPEFPLPAPHHGYHSKVAVDPLSNVCAMKTSHHTFPQLPVHPAKHYLRRNAERDSANFSMGSSGESDVCNGNLIPS